MRIVFSGDLFTMKGYTFEEEGARDASFLLYRQSISVFGLENTEEKIYRTIGRMLLAYEPQVASFFLSKYLEQKPEDADDIQALLNKRLRSEIVKPAVA